MIWERLKNKTIEIVCLMGTRIITYCVQTQIKRQNRGKRKNETQKSLEIVNRRIQIATEKKWRKKWQECDSQGSPDSKKMPPDLPYKSSRNTFKNSQSQNHNKTDKKKSHKHTETFFLQ